MAESSPNEPLFCGRPGVTQLGHASQLVQKFRPLTNFQKMTGGNQLLCKLEGLVHVGARKCKTKTCLPTYSRMCLPMRVQAPSGRRLTSTWAALT